MCRRGCKRVSFSPDPEAKGEPIYPTHNGLSSSRHGRRRVIVRFFSFGVRSSPAARRFLQRIGAKFAKTLRLISSRRKSTTDTKTTRSSSSIYLMKSKSLNESESHRAEAIEDCIKFLNSSSSSLSRSNSTAKRV